ncbi:hypothetical protein LPB03_06970 [Polaribacter vadi]|uniref:Addiction module family protein n=1 Tax=Polaribacter vadi TaxID=1774273 RepID=A0A1B8TZ14_9FLAO|nr:hypothetical protein [Polaribacter vadi]AOW17222.1 hypothetical protein LPB03_06970 [Polaribacter vadi]OBY64852.1 hypothetical protein LPB3_05520 [Polaribacter vadi]|tara:strand:- start:1268 stop:1516 length:249 start_codon:yes stop_codon:yes gene_type:complete
MESIALRNKIINQFEEFITDDSKLVVLEGVFDAITGNESVDSLVSEEHYKIVEERYQKKIKGETKGKSWDEVKQDLKQKYGF